jgi:prophage maintenance system killer protein
MKNNKIKALQEIVIYQGRGGKIEFRGDVQSDTVWGSLNQIAELFGRDKSVVSRHIKNIFKSSELSKAATVAKIATVQSEGTREIIREIEYYNLDMILSVGYRIDSKEATQFRIWATKTLKRHLLDGFTINKDRLTANYEKFMQAVTEIKSLLPSDNQVKAEDVLELVNTFASTWFSLDAYDKESFPQTGATKRQVAFAAKDLVAALDELKQELLTKKQTTELFGRERNKDAVDGIVGNIFQSFGKQDLYPTVEEKAAHLFYFIVKNHPFVDGNKRSGAFAFIWFLRKAKLLRASLTPEALTALTLLLAESNPRDKDKVIGLVLLLLRRE